MFEMLINPAKAERKPWEMFYMFRIEETRSSQDGGSAFQLIKDHRKALWAFLWLFVGFVLGFSFWYIILPTTESLQQQVGTFCLINDPGNAKCVETLTSKVQTSPTAFATNKERLFLIFANNIYVLIFTLIFSLLFGAGVIFILAWNASVIAAAIAIFTK